MNDRRTSSAPAPGGEDFYRRLCEHTSAALIATDREFRIVFLNPAAARILGADPADMLGRPIQDNVPPQRRKLFTRLLQRTLDRDETSQFEVALPAAGGGTMELLVMLSPMGETDGAPAGIAAWIADETHRKRMVERLKQAEKMGSLGTLAGGVAHHFNNILGGVATFVDFALTSGDPDAMRRALQMTAEATARASAITQSLLSFAEHDTHRADLADLTEVVLTFAHLVERPLTERNIALELDLKPIPVTAVEANRMHQALGNLLTNAEEAMEDEGGTVRLTLEPAGDGVALRFADSGAGIPRENLPQVFEPFYTTKGLLAGGDRNNPGLGLSVVHGIILEMGGRIEADSTPGEGTVFTITLPAGDSEPHDPADQ